MAYPFTMVDSWIISSFTVNREITDRGPPAQMINVTVSIGSYKRDQDGNIIMLDGAEVWQNIVHKNFTANMMDILIFIQALQPTIINGDPIYETVSECQVRFSGEQKFDSIGDPILNLNGEPTYYIGGEPILDINGLPIVTDKQKLIGYAEVSVPSQYLYDEPSNPNPFLAMDERLVAPIYQFTKFMIDSGRWNLFL